MRKSIEYTPPTPDMVLLHPYTFNIEKGYSYLLVDTQTVIESVLTTIETEPTSIYYKYSEEYSHLLSEINSFIGVWAGDSKLYMAVVYGFETDPFHITSNPNYIKMIKPDFESSDVG